MANSIYSRLARPAASENPLLTKPQRPLRSSDTRYAVGDFFSENGVEGVVYEVWDGGEHGRIVSLDEATLAWSKEVFMAGATSTTDGDSNTDKVLARADYEKSPAFIWCREHGAHWYLPAIDELAALLLDQEVFDAVNKTLEERGAKKLIDYNLNRICWSSTEHDERCAHNVYMNSHHTNFNYKHYDCRVRAVAKF